VCTTQIMTKDNRLPALRENWYNSCMIYEIGHERRLFCSVSIFIHSKGQLNISNIKLFLFLFKWNLFKIISNSNQTNIQVGLILTSRPKKKTMRNCRQILPGTKVTTTHETIVKTKTNACSSDSSIDILPATIVFFFAQDKLVIITRSRNGIT
jgi:hypothetical protein